MKKHFSALIALLFLCTGAWAQAEQEEEMPEISDSLMAVITAQIDSIDNSFDYQSGTVVVSDGLATLNLPEGYRYLGPEQAEYVLTELWENPPGSGSLGLVFPTGGHAHEWQFLGYRYFL